MRLVNAIVAQFPITLDIKHNLNVILSSLQSEGRRSDCSTRRRAVGLRRRCKVFDRIDISQLQTSLQTLRELVTQETSIVFGSCLHEDSKWFNAGIYYSPHKEFIYRKVNLATSERGRFIAGSNLGIIETLINDQPVK